MNGRTGPTRRSAAPAAQRGAVLFTALIMLVLITLLALTASRTSILEEKMTSGLRNVQLARLGAETVARNAEVSLWSISAQYLLNKVESPYVVCGAAGLFGCYLYRPQSPVAGVTTFKTAKGWDTTSSTPFKMGSVDMTAMSSDATANLAKQPVQVIEDLGIERPPGTPAAHESGVTGGGAGNRSVDKHVFRITGRSTGGTASVVQTVQTTFAAKSD